MAGPSFRIIRFDFITIKHYKVIKIIFIDKKAKQIHFIFIAIK